MLPPEAFAEAVAFLRLFDLKALVVTNATCSSLAVKASARIRWEEFPGIRVYIWNDSIEIFRVNFMKFVAKLVFPKKDSMADFVEAAFPNCIFEDLTIFCFRGTHPLNAIGRVSDSVVVKGVLRHSDFMRLDESLSLVQKFRKVKALTLARAIRDDELNQIANFYRGSGVQELHYRPAGKWPPKKLVLS